MTTAAFFFALVAAFGWIGFDAARKSLSKDLDSSTLVIALFLGQALFFGGWLTFADATPPGEGYAWPATASILLNVAANFMFVQSVRMSPLSRTIPLLSLSPVITSVVGIFVLNEIPTAIQWVGLVLVVVGALSLNLGRDRQWTRSFRALLADRGSLLMVIVAALWSLTAVFDKQAKDASSMPWHGALLGVGVGVVLLVFLAVSGKLSMLGKVRKRPVGLLLAISIGSGAFALQLLAYDGGMVAHIETIKRVVGLVMAVVIGRAFFSEEITPAMLVSIVLMGSGVSALLLG